MQKLVMCTAAGEQHGWINTLTNAVQANDFKAMDPKFKAIAEKEKAEDSRIVKVEYLNSRGRHERLTKPYCKYAGDPIQMWHFIPGHTYEVPLGLVKEVNDSASRIKKRAGLLSVDGKDVNHDGSPMEKDSDGEWIHKFVPVGF